MSDSEKRRIRDANGASNTLIGAGCKIEGKFSGRGNIVISGDIEGECDIEGTVTLTENGRWRGTIKANSVIVAGTVEGDICASDLVEIGSTARVSGTVSSEAIAVAAGAVVEGLMQIPAVIAPTEFVQKRAAK